MPRRPAACLYQETRVNVDPTSPSKVVDVQVPTSGAYSFASRASPKRRRLDRSPLTDEITFARNNLATESSIYFRSHDEKKSNLARPSRVLWRVLEDRTLLELQALELYQEPGKDEPLLTLRFSFQSSIIPGGIAFTELSDGSGSLLVFALTNRGEINTLKIRNQDFYKAGLLDRDRNVNPDWCKTYTVKNLGFRSPHRLAVHHDRSLWVALSDGSLVHVHRDPEDQGFKWTDDPFLFGTWGDSLRGLLPWRAQTTVRCGNKDLDLRTSVSMVMAPDGLHLWMVTLNHTLNAMNIGTKSITIERDLVRDDRRDFRKPFEQPLDPKHSNLIQIVPKRFGEYTIVTYSPVGRQFKFWDVKHADSNPPAVSDAHPDFVFMPPMEDLLGANVWTLECFHAVPPHDRRRKHWKIWMLIRAGARSHIFNVDVELGASKKDLSKSWSNNWAEVSGGPSTTDELRQNVDCPAGAAEQEFPNICTSSVERWIEHIFYPGRFSDDALGTALFVYQKSLGRRGKHLSRYDFTSVSLKDQICEVVGSSSQLELNDSGAVDYESFRRNVVHHWESFYGILRDLQMQREMSLHVAYDLQSETPWVLMADKVSAIRKCCDLELLWHNRDHFSNPGAFTNESILLKELGDSSDSECGQFFDALGRFCSIFPKSARLSFRQNVIADIFSPRLDPLPKRIQQVYTASGFKERITDEDYDKLADSFQGNVKLEELGGELFKKILKLLSAELRGKYQHRQISRYGVRTLVSGSEDTLRLGSEIVFGIALLVIFMACEIHEEDLSPEFDAPDIYARILSKILEHETLSWLAKTPLEDHSTDAAEASDSRARAKTQNLNMLERMFIGEWSDMPTPQGLTLIDALTYWVRAWTFGPSVNDNQPSITPSVMTVLLKNGDLHHASEFLRFLTWSSWSAYVRGRYFLAMGSLEEASHCFTRAAPDLVEKYFPVDCHDAEKLLQPDEQAFFGEGLPLYYQHIANLFEKGQAMSFVADFADLAFRALPFKKESAGLRIDLLSRLFTAYLKTSRFTQAFETLTRYTDKALRKNALNSLLHSLIVASQVSLLLSLPYPAEMVQEADAYLAQLCGQSSTSGSSPFTTTSTPATGLPITPYKTLYAFRTRHSNFRGAALCLWERLQRLRIEQQNGLRGRDVDEEVGQCYLMLINCLCLVDKDMAWILVRPIVRQHGGQEVRGTRKVVTLDDMRREWQAELDRVADLEAGRYPLGTEVMDWGDEEEEEDEEEEDGAVEVQNEIPRINGIGGPSAMEIDAVFG